MQQKRCVCMKVSSTILEFFCLKLFSSKYSFVIYFINTKINVCVIILL